MQINQQQVQQFIQWLQNHWVGGQHCSVCNHTDWVVNDRVYELTEHLPGVHNPPVVQPVLTVICRNCGHTVHFNAIQAGIIAGNQGDQR